MQQHGLHHHSSEMETCIRNCSDCHHVCIETLSYCLQQGGQHAEHAHIRLLQDCIQICHTSEDFMLRGSDLHGYTCGVCAVVCEQCAEDCERMSADAQMQACADMCRRCAASCRSMSKSMLN